MKLYHAGFQVIEKPDVHYGRKNADFGQGFYLTDDEKFACRWARSRKGETTILNTYELEPDGLTVHRFRKEKAWFSYLFGNRRGRPDTLSADVIIGPIANDTIYDTLGILTSGFLSEEEALDLLFIGPEYQQIALKTTKAAKALRFLSAREITPEEIARYREVVAKEQDEYLTALSKRMEEENFS